MHRKNRVSVRIMGHDYKLVSEETQEYMAHLAGFVDKKMSEISNGNKKLSNAMIAVLAALNISDELIKLKERGGVYSLDAADDGENSLFQLQLKAVEEELNQRNRDYEKMVHDFEALMENSSTYEDELQGLREKMSILSYELNTKDEQLKRSIQTVRDLRKQITDKELLRQEIDELAVRRENKEFQLTFEQLDE